MTMVLSIILIFYLLLIALVVLLIASYWKLFTKAGEPGWMAIIPYANMYFLFKIAGKKNLFWWYLGISIVSVIVSFVSQIAMIGLNYETNSNVYYGSEPEISGAAIITIIICTIVTLAAAIISLVIRILMSIGIAKNFGAGSGFAVGLIFLPYIFYPILAFSREYQYLPGRTGCPPRFLNVSPQYGNVPPQYGNVPPQYGNVPPQYGNVPPQYGNVPPQYGNMPPHGGNQS